ncbi:MAG TPA: phosphodiester glycosidase family protein [Armatimonadota bacterium]|nr:phosphodiester glycosidase family protein [Armatimonadota bacterium]
MKTRATTAISLLLLASITWAADVAILEAAPGAEGDSPIAYWAEQWETPRPVRLHFLRVDLASPGIEVLAIVGEDPDGEGPAEATLTRPTQLLAAESASAGVNANFFRHLPSASDEEKKRGWFVGKHVDICGLAAADDAVRSQPEEKFPGFWIDGAGNPHVGPADVDEVADGVSGLPLLRDGENLRAPDGPLHPRTLVGLDAEARYMLIVIADGRRPGYSEGVSLYECAELMKTHGCSDAVNLDGGGSSVMLIQEEEPRVMNRPSGAMRPIPVMLAIRKN